MTTFRVPWHHDTDLATDGEVLVYDEDSGRWVPAPAPEGGGGESIKVGGSQPVSGWWLDTGSPEPVDPYTVTPTAPTFTDQPGTASDTYTIPSQTGVIYRVNGTVTAAGTYTPTAGQAVTITATAAAGYTLVGTTSWSHTFSTATGPDTTSPDAGTLTPSAVTQSGFTVSISGASDDVALASEPYAFSVDGGAWSAYQSSASYDVTGKSPSTAYTVQHRVKDAAGNVATGAAITVTTSAPAPLLEDTFTRATTTTGGTLGTAETGQAWSDPNAKFLISNGVAKGSGIMDIAAASAEVGQVSVKARCKVVIAGSNSSTGIIVANTQGTATSGYRLELREGAMWLTAYSNTGQMLHGFGPVGGIPVATGDEFELTVAEGGTSAVVSLTKNGTPLTMSNTQGTAGLTSVAFTHADRPTGTSVAIIAKDVAADSGIDEITVYPA